MSKTVYAEPTPIKKNATDFQMEAETVVTWSKADQAVHIATSISTDIRALDRNPSAKKIEVNGKTHFFELPLGMVTFRNKRGTRKKGIVVKNACGAPTQSGKPCQRIASKETGRCPKHPIS